jgi:hypothetical protein
VVDELADGLLPAHELPFLPVNQVGYRLNSQARGAWIGAYSS